MSCNDASSRFGAELGRAKAVPAPVGRAIWGTLLGLVCIAVSAGGATMVAAKPNRDAVLTSLSVSDGVVQVDWSRGVMIARGGASADLRAPTPAVARVAAKRQAEASARERLLVAATTLLAEAGGIVAPPSAGGDPTPERARLEAAIEAARIERLRYASDGSVTLDAVLPLEALRLVAKGPRLVAGAAPDAAPTAVVVRAGTHLEAPVLGLSLVVDGKALGGPVVYARAGKAAIVPAVAGPRPLSVEASGATAPAVLVASATDPEGASALARLADTRDILIVVLLEGKKK